jgi:hypothetical protein
MNARDSLDGVAVTVKLAVSEFGAKRVARELRSMATVLECRGTLPGLNFDEIEMADAAKHNRRGAA